MVASQWINLDGLNLQFGTQKAVPEVGGDYLAYGETRVVETYIGLVPFTFSSGSSSIVVPAAPTSFSGTSTAAAAGITSLTTFIPLQSTAPITSTTSGNLIINAPQLFIESVTVETLVAAAGGTSLSVGLACINPATQQFVQITPNAGVQIVNGILTANMNTTGMCATYYQPGSTTSSVPASVAGGGSWIGNVPLVTNAITPLPNSAYISAIATGTFTNGLLRVRVRYNTYGGINQ